MMEHQKKGFSKQIVRKKTWVNLKRKLWNRELPRTDVSAAPSKVVEPAAPAACPVPAPRLSIGSAPLVPSAASAAPAAPAGTAKEPLERVVSNGAPNPAPRLSFGAAPVSPGSGPAAAPAAAAASTSSRYLAVSQRDREMKSSLAPFHGLETLSTRLRVPLTVVAGSTNIRRSVAKTVSLFPRSECLLFSVCISTSMIRSIDDLRWWHQHRPNVRVGLAAAGAFETVEPVASDGEGHRLLRKTAGADQRQRHGVAQGESFVFLEISARNLTSGSLG